MPGNNFKDVLEIDEDGHIVPGGPLVVPKEGERITKLYAWVFQLKPDGTGAMCVANQEEGLAELAPGPNVWEATALPIHEGTFVPGPAFGMAALISKDSGDKPRVYWWSENILLKQGKSTTAESQLLELSQRLAELEAKIRADK